MRSNPRGNKRPSSTRLGPAWELHRCIKGDWQNGPRATADLLERERNGRTGPRGPASGDCPELNTQTIAKSYKEHETRLGPAWELHRCIKSDWQNGPRATADLLERERNGRTGPRGPASGDCLELNAQTIAKSYEEHKTRYDMINTNTNQTNHTAATARPTPIADWEGSLPPAPPVQNATVGRTDMIACANALRHAYPRLAVGCLSQRQSFHITGSFTSGVQTRGSFLGSTVRFKRLRLLRKATRAAVLGSARAASGHSAAHTVEIHAAKGDGNHYDLKVNSGNQKRLARMLVHIGTNKELLSLCSNQPAPASGRRDPRPQHQPPLVQQLPPHQQPSPVQQPPPALQTLPEQQPLLEQLTPGQAMLPGLQQEQGRNSARKRLHESMVRGGERAERCLNCNDADNVEICAANLSMVGILHAWKWKGLASVLHAMHAARYIQWRGKGCCMHREGKHTACIGHGKAWVVRCMPGSVGVLREIQEVHYTRWKGKGRCVQRDWEHATCIGSGRVWRVCCMPGNGDVLCAVHMIRRMQWQRKGHHMHWNWEHATYSVNGRAWRAGCMPGNVGMLHIMHASRSMHWPWKGCCIQQKWKHAAYKGREKALWMCGEPGYGKYKPPAPHTAVARPLATTRSLPTCTPHGLTALHPPGRREQEIRTWRALLEAPMLRRARRPARAALVLEKGDRSCRSQTTHGDSALPHPPPPHAETGTGGQTIPVFTHPLRCPLLEHWKTGPLICMRKQTRTHLFSLPPQGSLPPPRTPGRIYPRHWHLPTSPATHASRPIPLMRRLVLTLLAMAGDVEPNPGPATPPWHTHPLYLEPQEERFCIAHAFNAFVGSHIVSGHTLLDYCNLLKNAFQSNTFMHMGVYDDQSVHSKGNFSQLVLDHWLYHGCDIWWNCALSQPVHQFTYKCRGWTSCTC